MTNQNKREMLDRQLARIENMSERAEYARALSGLTGTMLDVMQRQTEMELMAEGGAWGTARALRDGLNDLVVGLLKLSQDVGKVSGGSEEASWRATRLTNDADKLLELSLTLMRLLNVPDADA